jgi:hypothetical protein
MASRTTAAALLGLAATLVTAAPAGASTRHRTLNLTVTETVTSVSCRRGGAVVDCDSLGGHLQAGDKVVVGEVDRVGRRIVATAATVLVAESESSGYINHNVTFRDGSKLTFDGITDRVIEGIDPNCCAVYYLKAGSGRFKHATVGKLFQRPLSQASAVNTYYVRY